MASPPVDQRGTGDRGLGALGANGSATQKAKVPAKAPDKTLAPIGSCREFITINPERSNTSTGTAIHRIIREQVGAYISAQGYGPPLQIRLPDASFAHYRDQNAMVIGNKRSGSGDFDLAFRSLTGAVMLVAEIKPANWEALVGETQLANYIDKANASEQIKRQWNVLVFSPVRPLEASLPPEVIYQSRRFEIRWCGPGIILYKEIKEDEDKDDKKKRKANKPKSVEELVAEDKRWWEHVKPIRAAPRPMKFEAWVPEALKQDVLANKMPDGVYRNRYQAKWPSGYSSDVVLWVKTGPFGREYQYYQEFPSDPAFYEYLAGKKGLSQWQRELVRSTLVEYNNDLWSLIAPSRETGAPSGRSPEYARAELRTIYADVLKSVVGGSATIVAAGAATTGLVNSMRQRATQGRALQGRSTMDEDVPGAPDEPLPDWAAKAIDRGFEQARKRGPSDELLPDQAAKAIEKGFEQARRRSTMGVLR